MYCCEKCAEKIEDISRPCPTCGMYLNSYNSDNSNKNKSFFNYVLIFGFIFLIVLSVGFVSYSYASSVMEISGDNYSLKYKLDTWSVNKSSDDEYYYLQYNDNSNVFLQIPKEATELNKNLDDVDVREDLYSLYLMELIDSPQISYTNIMSEIRRLDDSDYYYLSADFLQYSNAKYKGKVYLLHNVEGKTLCILLNLGGEDIDNVEEDIFKLFRDMDI